MTVMVMVAVPVPPGPVATMVSLTAAVTTVGVPEMTPVLKFSVKPAGSAGLPELSA